MEWLFQKETSEITLDDLREKLSDRPEGFYMEYKGRDTIDDNDTIAKEIAAFANTYGGWLFIGIDTDEDNKPLLCDPPGVPKEKANSERIQQIAQSHLAPGPYIASVQVPLAEDDPNSDVILGIYIEESGDPPLIRRRDGRVYRRSGDVSQPVKDRTELDRLYDKALRNHERVQERLERHERGQWVLAALRQYDLKTGSKSEPFYEGYVLLLAYPFSGAFHTPWLIASGDGAYADIKRGAPSLPSLLKYTRGYSYPDGSTAILYAERQQGCQALQVDVYGRVVLAKLVHYSPRGHTLKENAEPFHKGCQEFYREQGYYGRVGLIYRLGLNVGDKHILLSRVAAAPAMDEVDVAELGEEAARALGDRDQRPWRDEG